MAISTIAEIEHLHNVHSGSPQTTQRNPPQITKIYSMIFKQQLTDISTVLNNTGNTTKLLTSFNALDIAQQKVLLSSSLLSEKQKEQCITMATLSAANTKYTAEQLAKATGISTETLANWGLIESTDALTISELSQRAASDAQAKAILDKIIAQNAEAVANGKIIASNTALTASEGGATLATGAFTTAIKANIKAMITWMTTTPLGWLTMLVGGVFLAVKAYDALTVSVKEQKEKMEDSLSAYKDAKSELSNITTELENQEQTMDDLLAKEKLTYAEQGQLEELQAITRELRIQKDLAEKEEGRTQKEVAKDASDLFNKQFGKYDISEDAIGEYQNNANITGNNAILISDENDISSMIAGYRQFNDLLDEAYGSESQEDIDHFKSLTEGLKDSIFETAQELQEQQSNIADYYNTIKDIPYDDLTTEQKGIVDSYNSISDAIELIYQQLDSNTWKSMQIESVFDTEGIEKTKEELIEMVKAGEFDESTLQSYPKLSAALEQNKVSASELRNELEALAEAEGNVKGDTFNDENPISLTDIISDLNDMEESLNSVNDLYKEFKDKDKEGFSNEKLASFIEAFKEIKNVNVSDFLDTLTNASSTAQEVQDAFNKLATEYIDSTGILDQVTESNEKYIAAKLEEIGITNAVELVEAQLVVQRHGAELSTIDVKNATYGEIAALRDEIAVTGEAKLAINQYYLEKIAANKISLSTSGDIENIMSLVKACGSGIAALKAFYEAKQGLQNAFKNTLSQDNWMASTTIGQAEARKKLETQFAEYKKNEEDLIAKAEAEIDAALNKKYAVGSNYGGNASNSSGSKSGGSKKKEKKDAEEVYDWIETLIKRTDEKIEELQKKATDAKGWRAKNALQDTVFDELQKKLVQLQADYDRYMQEANSVGLSDIYINKIQNGELDIERLESTEENEAVKEKIKEYQTW